MSIYRTEQLIASAPGRLHKRPNTMFDQVPSTQNCNLQILLSRTVRGTAFLLLPLPAKGLERRQAQDIPHFRA